MKKLILLLLFIPLVSCQNGEVRKTYYESGELESTVYYWDGVMEGEWKGYYKSGELQATVNYGWDGVDAVSGLQKGEKKEYYRSGELKSTVNIVDDLRQGELKRYYESGELQYTENFIDDLRQGQLKVYYKSGELLSTRNIEDGITYYLGNKVFDRNNNTTKSYFKNGKLASLTQSNDSLSKETRWFISGEKEYESVSNSINNTGNIKMWQNKKLLHNINLSNGSVIVNEKNKIETNNFLNYSRESSGVIRSLSPEKSEEIEIFNSPYGDKIGEYNDYLTYYSYEEYGIEYSDHINGRLEIGFSLWINDDVPFSSWLESTSYGYALSTGLVLRSKPDKYSKKIIAFQGGSYDVSVIGWSWGAQEFINGYSKVRVDLYEEDPCDGGSVTKSWEGWAKVIDDFGNPNIYYSAVGC